MLLEFPRHKDTRGVNDIRSLKEDDDIIPVRMGN